MKKDENRKRALVLGTGGVRGAYFTGLHGAIKYRGIFFDTIAGASAGAIAGAWLAADMHEQELQSWKEFSKYKIAWHPLFNNETWKTVDLSIQLTTLQYLDLQRVRDSQTHLYVAASRLMLNGEYLRHCFDVRRAPDTTSVGLYLRASAFLPYVNGIGTAVEIGEEKYRDAGLTGRIPLDILPQNYYDEIWLILCSPASIDELPAVLMRFPQKDRVHVLVPSRDLPVGRMSSDMNKIEATINIGYEDGLKFIDKILAGQIDT